MKSVRQLGLAILTIALLGAGLAQAVETIESSIETTSAGLQLPSSQSDPLMVRDCAACISRLYRMDERTTFEFNGQPIAYQRLRQLFAERDYNVLVTVRPGGNTLRRIVITGTDGSR